MAYNATDDKLLVRFAHPAPAYKYSLLALPPSLVGQQLELRSSGSTAGAAVLVSPTTSYALRAVQNSNETLVCFPSILVDGQEQEDGVEVQARLTETLELATTGKSTTWRDELVRMLAGSAYAYDPEAKRQAEGTSWEELGKSTPAADGEIMGLLSREFGFLLPDEQQQDAKAEQRPTKRVKLDDSGRKLVKVLPRSLAQKAFSELLRECMDVPAAQWTVHSPSSSSSSSATPAATAAAGKKAAPQPEQQDYLVPLPPSSIADALSAAFGTSSLPAAVSSAILFHVSSSSVEALESSTKVSPLKLVQQLGLGLLELQGAGKTNAQPLGGFMAKWLEEVKAVDPTGASWTSEKKGGHKRAKEVLGYAKLDNLKPHFHLSQLGSQQQLTYLPPRSLSSEPSVLFSELFALSPRWVPADLLVYLDRCVLDELGEESEEKERKKRREALVAKFVRKVRDGGKEGWCSRVNY